MRIENAEWLKDPVLQRLFDALEGNGAETRVVGGAVRNTLMDEDVTEVDLCTTLLPDAVVERLNGSDFKTVPTGIEHGTVTVVSGGQNYEITTLREDVETDGRHAVVRFGTDWQRDAERRDLTINALYCDRHGLIHDPLQGIDDVMKREVRFIGDPARRISEDALRILRFFRFFAQYGSGRPDAAGLKACAASRTSIKQLSAERVWTELRKILSVSDPGRALLWMRTTGILEMVLPESEKWGIDTIPSLVRLEASENWAPDPLIRLMAIIRPHVPNVQQLAKRLAMSNRELERLEAWAESQPPAFDVSMEEFQKQLYRGSQQGIVDRIRLEAAHQEADRNGGQLEKLLKMICQARRWQRPSMPVQGRDLVELGISAGPEMGKILSELEEAWIDSGFQLDRQALLVMVQDNQE